MSSDNPGSPPPPDSADASIVPLDSAPLPETRIAELRVARGRHPAFGGDPEKANEVPLGLVREISDSESDETLVSLDAPMSTDATSPSASLGVFDGNAHLEKHGFGKVGQFVAAIKKRLADATTETPLVRTLRKELIEAHNAQQDAEIQVAMLTAGNSQLKKDLAASAAREKQTERRISVLTLIRDQTAEISAQQDTKILALQERIDALQAELDRGPFDELTGLQTRRQIEIAATRNVNHVKHQNQPSVEGLNTNSRMGDRAKNTVVWIAGIDIDGFKEVNETYGHAGGDDVLRAIAHRLQSCFREEDDLGRQGGDEFRGVGVSSNREGVIGSARRAQLGLRFTHDDVRAIVSAGEANAPLYQSLVKLGQFTSPLQDQLPAEELADLKAQSVALFGTQRDWTARDTPNPSITSAPGERLAPGGFALTASIGLVMSDGTEPAAVLELRADQAQRLAKFLGKNQVVIWDPSVPAKLAKFVSNSDQPDGGSSPEEHIDLVALARVPQLSETAQKAAMLRYIPPTVLPRLGKFTPLENESSD